MSEVNATESESIAIVREFWVAFETGAVDKAVDLLDPDIAWLNTSLPTLRGIRNVRRVLAPMLRANSEVRMNHIAAAGDTVLTDRTDILKLGPVEIPFWVCGTFELRDGRIVVWHDHFSWGNMIFAALTAVPRALMRRRVR